MLAHDHRIDVLTGSLFSILRYDNGDYKMGTLCKTDSTQLILIDHEESNNWIRKLVGPFFALVKLNYGLFFLFVDFLQQFLAFVAANRMESRKQVRISMDILEFGIQLNWPLWIQAIRRNPCFFYLRFRNDCAISMPSFCIYREFKSSGLHG